MMTVYVGGGGVMSTVAPELEDTGLEVLDLRDNAPFAGRRLKSHDVPIQMRAIQRLSHALAENPETILQELVDAAVSLCGADSAGISLVKENATPDRFYEWVATAGQYSGFLHAVLPQHPSACGVCLERGGPQLFRVSQRFFEILGVEAPPVTDGLLLPWQAGETEGTIFIMAHGRTEAFDAQDCGIMQMLADFAVLATRRKQQQQALMEQAIAKAAAAMANDLAHQINNPLQSLTNLVYLVTESEEPASPKLFRQEMQDDLKRLNALVKNLLVLPGLTSR